MRFVKPYILTVLVSLLAVLLAEMLFYPLNPARLAEDASTKTTGSIMILTDETPQELRIYHRALFLPRYRLDSAGKLPKEECMTANVDWFQTFVLSVENRQIVLYDPQYNTDNLIKLPVTFIWFTVLLYQTWVSLYQKAKSRR